LQKLYENHKDKIDFFWIYSQEARSSDTGLSDSKDKSPLKIVKNHRTIEDRKASAFLCAKEISSNIPQLLDDLDNSITIRYHGHPTRLFVIGQNNKISYAGKLGPLGTNIKAFTKIVRKEYNALNP